MDSVSGNGDGFLLHLNVVDLVIVVEDDLLSGRLLNRLQADVDIAVHDRQITGHGELITLDGGDVVDADVDSVSGNGDGLFLHLNIVDLVIVVEDDLLFSRCSALTVQENHGGIRDNPLVTVVVQRDGHGGAHTGMHLRIGAIRRHIGGGVELDVVVITLDAQTVARYRVAVVQQAGGDGLMALGVAVHLEVPQVGLQLVIRGGDSADLDGGNAVINVHIALLGHLVPAGNLLGGDFADVDLVRVSRDFHGVGVAHLLTGYHIHKLDGNLLFSRCSALTVQENHGVIRDNPLVTVVVQRDGHGGAHTGMHLRIGAIRRHIGGGVELDVVVITLDAQTVARYRVAVVQQAGGDGLMALGVAVHLEVPQVGLQLVIRGGDSADLDGGNAVINVHIALLGHLVPAGNLLGGDFADVDLVRVSRDFHGVGVAHLLTGYHIHKLDGDGHRFGLLGIDGVKGQITFLVVLVPAIGIVYQLGQCTVRKETIILILAIRVERPAGDLFVDIVRGRSSRFILLDRLHSANHG